MNQSKKLKAMSLNNTSRQKQIAIFAKAMAHPTRVAILQYLASLDSCYFGDIHKELGMSKANVSEHLRLLKESGLIQGEIMPPKVKYCINSENWKIALNEFVNLLSPKKKRKKCCK